MRASRVPFIVCLAAIALGQGVAAQPFVHTLFERHLESLRQQVGIPGLSAAIVQGGRIAWETGLGSANLESGVSAAPDTPYPIGDLSQIFASALLGQCAQGGRLRLDEPIRRWTNAIPETNATVMSVLAHASDAAVQGYRLDAGRFAALTTVAEQCAGDGYRRLVADELLDRAGMADSVPAQELADAATAERFGFEGREAGRYAAVLRRMAAPYRVDRSGRATRSEYTVVGLDASTGIVSTVRDLARFDAALDDRDLVRQEMLDLAWHNTAGPGGALPTGLGWFVQSYNNERLVWQFNLARDAYSALILKVPGRNLTLILLANSDGLSAPFSLADGDVTSSLFARTFLRLFL